MGIFGIGTDIAVTTRVFGVWARRGSNKRERFLQKAYHTNEIVAFHALQHEDEQARFLASRWAAKEALTKAIGRRVLFPEMEVTRSTDAAHAAGKAPVFRFHGELRQLVEEELHVKSHLSISHDGELALAFVVLEAQ